MKEKLPIRRYIFWIVLIVLIIAYPLFWYINIATTPTNPDQFLDPTGVAVAVAIILGFFYYGALWLASLIYTVILYALKKITKERFLISLFALLTVLVIAGVAVLVIP